MAAKKCLCIRLCFCRFADLKLKPMLGIFSTGSKQNISGICVANYFLKFVIITKCTRNPTLNVFKLIKLVYKDHPRTRQ